MDTIGQQMGFIIGEYKEVMQLVVRELENDEKLLTKEDCIEFLNNWIEKVDALGSVLSGL